MRRRSRSPLCPEPSRPEASRPRQGSRTGCARKHIRKSRHRQNRRRQYSPPAKSPEPPIAPAAAADAVPDWLKKVDASDRSPRLSPPGWPRLRRPNAEPPDWLRDLSGSAAIAEPQSTQPVQPSASPSTGSGAELPDWLKGLQESRRTLACPLAGRLRRRGREECGLARAGVGRRNARAVRPGVVRTAPEGFPTPVPEWLRGYCSRTYPGVR